MTESLRNWIMSILACGVLFCMAEAILPQGPVRSVGRMAIGLVLFLVVLRPLTGAVPQAIAAFLQVEVDVVSEDQLCLQQTNESYLETIMREKSEEYIEEQAEALGLAVTAEVSCVWQEGLPIPDAATVEGTSAESEVQPLLDTVEQELGIRRERIRYEEVTDP